MVVEYDTFLAWAHKQEVAPGIIHAYVNKESNVQTLIRETEELYPLLENNGGLELLIGQQIIAGKAGFIFENDFAPYVGSSCTNPEELGEAIVLLQAREPKERDICTHIGTIVQSAHRLEVEYTAAGTNLLLMTLRKPVTSMYGQQVLQFGS
jgi:hypothetical protein